MRITRKQLRHIIQEQVDEALEEEQPSDSAIDYEAFTIRAIDLGTSIVEAYEAYTGWLGSLNPEWYQPEFIEFFNFEEEGLVGPADIARVETKLREIDRYHANVDEAQDAKGYLEQLLQKLKEHWSHITSIPDHERNNLYPWLEENRPDLLDSLL
jgi:hypothetical protein|tara:strand:- start:168 stop:632 length:465 start_codon:yes stop_codon:yes gene_type:complete